MKNAIQCDERKNNADLRFSNSTRSNPLVRIQIGFFQVLAGQLLRFRSKKTDDILFIDNIHFIT